MTFLSCSRSLSSLQLFTVQCQSHKDRTVKAPQPLSCLSRHRDSNVTVLQHKCNINVHPITGPNPSQIWFSAHLLRSPWTTHRVPLFVFSINKASVWKSHQHNNSMVRSRGASRKPLCVFPEDSPMRVFYAHGAFLRGTGAPVGKGIGCSHPGQPKHTAQQELYSQAPPRDA